MKSTYIYHKYFNFYYKPHLAELTLKLGKNKAEPSHARSLTMSMSFHKKSSFGIFLRRDENQATLSIWLIFFSLSLGYSGFINYIVQSKNTWEYSLTFSNWTLRWNLGCNLNSWSTSDGLRNSNFNFLDFILGRILTSKIDIKSVEKIVKLPEGDYLAEMSFVDFTHWRKRIPKSIWNSTVRRVSLKITPEIPYPGKNSPVGGYSNISFPAKNVEEVMQKIYKDIKDKRGGSLDYYASEYRKIVDNYIYTINGLPINIGRIPVEKRNKVWYPLGCSSSQIADETFKKLWSKKGDFTPEEYGFIKKYMGIDNSIDFIRDTSKEEMQKNMQEYFKTRSMETGCSEGNTSYAIPKKKESIK